MNEDLKLGDVVVLNSGGKNMAARKLLLRGRSRVEPGRRAGTGCEGVWGERGEKMTKSECGMTNGA